MKRGRPEEVDTMEGLVGLLHSRYGEDVAQQALLETCERISREQLKIFISYAIGTAIRLRRWGHTDSKTPWGHEHSWGMEISEQGEDSWGARVGDPVRIAIAREALRALPEWVVRWHLEDEFVYRAPCGHAPKWLYPREDGRDKRVRCRLCVVDGVTRGRKRG